MYNYMIKTIQITILSPIILICAITLFVCGFFKDLLKGKFPDFKKIIMIEKYFFEFCNKEINEK